MVRKLATLGRSHTKEYVTEFVIQYSDDGEMWRSYVNPDGEVQVICCYSYADFYKGFFTLFTFTLNFQL